MLVNIEFFAEALSRNLVIRQGGSEWLGFFAVLWILLKSMVNIYRLLLKLCGENWPFVGEALRDWVFPEIDDKHM